MVSPILIVYSPWRGTINTTTLIEEVKDVAIEMMPTWMEALEEEDIAFIKNFVLCSGSLKQIAKDYNVTYPTVRLRLDRIIDKIKMQEDKEAKPYIKLIKKLALDDKIDFDTAKLLIHEYSKERT